ncbi:putative glucokinase [Fusarium flagelliforme]|uniref:Phosphotransferase n=2 Tax=Fusarium flagelliforme TaxID=2675880 RepID=A0A395MVX6_9HYPO|nr:putative glucokinase [Fusarium flagelliforme]
MLENDLGDGRSATVDSIVKELEIDGHKVQKITNHFVQQMQHGLKAKHSYQIPSFVTEIPIGQEKGLVLAVDLGGTNCRVCAVNLHGDSTFDVFQRKHLIPPELRVNESYKPLFEFIALKIGDFLHEYALEIRKGGLKQQTFNLGFTFSFTCEQTSLSQGTLVHWDKGWDIPSAVNQDPCSLLQAAIDEIALPVRVCVLANDAVGTLLTKAYTAKKSDATLAAIILGTGTNAAYVEQTSNIPRLGLDEKTKGDGVMVINTEWGSWDDELAVLPQTRFDKLIDQSSSDPGCGLLEKMVSGMYLGELLRLMLLALIQTGELSLVLDANSPAHRHMGIETALLTRVSAFAAEDTQGALVYVMGTLMAKDVTIQDLRLLQTLAKGIITRSARLVGAGLAAILIRSGRLQPTMTTPKTTTITQAQEVITKSTKQQENSAISSFVSFIKSLCGCIAPDSEPSLPTSKSSYESDEMVNSAVLMEEEINVAVDGSLFEFHTEFEELMRGALRDVAEVGRLHEGRIKIELTKDGSGTGAALIAAVAG